MWNKPSKATKLDHSSNNADIPVTVITFRMSCLYINTVLTASPYSYSWLRHCEKLTFINNYWMRISMLSRIIQTKVNVIGRRRKLRWITLTEVWIISNYSPKWRWIVVDIYRAAKQRSKYLHDSPTLRWIIVLAYTSHNCFHTLTSLIF